MISSALRQPDEPAEHRSKPEVPTRGSANPTITLVVKLAGVLQVSIEELIGSPKETCRFYPANELQTNRRGEVVIRKILPDPLPGIDFDAPGATARRSDANPVTPVSKTVIPQPLLS